jgi:shikimate kinase
VRSPRAPKAGLRHSVRSNAVFLVGFMGAGKSSVGRALAQRLNWIFEDLDDRIERREGRTVAEIFGDSGEAEFRRAERAALMQLLEEQRGGVAGIVALGGGAFVQKDNAALLKAAGVPTVFLDAAVEELWRRCCAQASQSGAERPLLKSEAQFRKLHASRRGSYLKASLKVDTGSRAVEAIAAEIVERLKLKEIGLRTEEGESE